MKHKTVIAAVCFALALILAGAVLIYTKKRNTTDSSEAFKTEFFTMDTVCGITLYGNSDLSEYRALIERLDKELDSHDEGSSIYKFNQSGSGELSKNAAELYDKSKTLFEQYGNVDVTYGGLIALWGITSDSPRVPSDEEIAAELEKAGFDKLEQNGSKLHSVSGASLDFGATAKGYALDKVYEELKENGESCAVVTLGSSTLLYGKKPDGKPFKTGVKDPFSPDRLLLTFESGEAFVSTSGGYERFFEAGGKRYIHILDLKTGRPSESDLASVTVICDSGIKSDFLSTAIFIGGREGLTKYLDDSSIQIIAVDNEGEIIYSQSLGGKIAMNGG